MTGSVSEIHLDEGWPVTEFTEVITIECMKSLWPIEASMEGIVTEILVQVGQIVNEGDVLFKVEAK